MRENFAQARIVIIASPIAAQVLKANPLSLEIITVAEKWDLLKNLTQIRKENFDVAVSFSQLGCFFTRFCATSFWSDFTMISGQGDRSVVQMCNDVLQTMDVHCTSTKTEFWCSERDQRIVELFLKGSGYQSEKPLVAIHCGGHYFSRKRWSLVNFIKVVRFLNAEAGFQVVLVGGIEDVEDSLFVRSMVPNIITAVGMMKLSETAALLKKCHLFIGNDSGPLHLAAALSTPTIGLFGPTNPRQFYPYPPPRHTYIYKALSCSPCYKFGGGIWQYVPRCSKAYCMDAITIEDLIKQVELDIPFISKQSTGWAYAGKT